MSDPAKTPEEIEDVLASIRRLVSDNSPTPVAPLNEKPTAVADDRLVLSPSFRVTDPEDPWVPVSAAKPSEPKPSLLTNADTAQRNDTGWQPDDRLVNFDDVGDMLDDGDQADADVADLLQLDGAEAEPADFEPETGDDNWPNPGAESALLTLVARRDPAGGRAAPEPEADDTGHSTDDDISDDAPHGDTDQGGDASDVSVLGDLVQEALNEDVSEFDPAVELADADDADGGSEEQTFVDALVADAISEDAKDQEAGVEDAAEIVSDEDDISADRYDEDSDDAAAPDQTNTDEAHEDAPAHLEEDDDMYTAHQNQTEADVPHDEPTPIPVFSARPATEDTVDDLGDDPSPFSLPEAEDGILDEETLREIIVDVVREELQGVLGQRITRNVRKMVRREVRLALAAEDLE